MSESVSVENEIGEVSGVGEVVVRDVGVGGVRPSSVSVSYIESVSRVSVEGVPSVVVELLSSERGVGGEGVVEAISVGDVEVFGVEFGDGGVGFLSPSLFECDVFLEGLGVDGVGGLVGERVPVGVYDGVSVVCLKMPVGRLGVSEMVRLLDVGLVEDGGRVFVPKQSFLVARLLVLGLYGVGFGLPIGGVVLGTSVLSGDVRLGALVLGVSLVVLAVPFVWSRLFSLSVRLGLWFERVSSRWRSFEERLFVEWFE